MLTRPAWPACRARGPVSARQIAARLGVSRSAVLAVGEREAVCARFHNGHEVKGQVPFGWDSGDAGRLVKNAGKQQVIRMIRQLHAERQSLNAIVRELNRRLAPAKNAELSQANPVAKILRRLLALQR